ncbi:BrnT family toxin [Methylobacterium aerolatum]|uniref:Uncharacterized DUF497 family protein n=1 Tax=Methylobacterium aerolatum TaxID=418708 RepID=A0ABU0I5E4_9HYPH|nr:BrnT family toxin [Methylobacterium aerolatum]MDQ0448844.1 uncharacterized DUF497 family protein [Methylobacterium aerolatum]GJD34208.1 hypothetical protein FMGBMHLM_1104 [Methylobacterium aerolatum]
MRMVWDDHKRAANILKHGMDFADAADRFEWEGAMIAPAHADRFGAPRFMAVGWLEGRMVSLTFAPLGTEAIAAISLRTASNRERRAYAAQCEDDASGPHGADADG